MSGNDTTSEFVNAVTGGVSGGYNGDVFAIKFIILMFAVMTVYNSLELIILIFSFFNSYGSLYFWSLLAASAGVTPYAIGFTLKFLNILEGDVRYLSLVLIASGWITFVTGQSLVLWSRLHLVVGGSERGDRILKYTKWMIICNAIFVGIPTIVTAFGSWTGVNESWTQGYNVMEKLQLTGFL